MLSPVPNEHCILVSQQQSTLPAGSGPRSSRSRPNFSKSWAREKYSDIRRTGRDQNRLTRSVWVKEEVLADRHFYIPSKSKSYQTQCLSDSDSEPESWFEKSKKFQHNICNPDLARSSPSWSQKSVTFSAYSSEMQRSHSSPEQDMLRRREECSTGKYEKSRVRSNNNKWVFLSTKFMNSFKGGGSKDFTKSESFVAKDNKKKHDPKVPGEDPYCTCQKFHCHTFSNNHLRRKTYRDEHLYSIFEHSLPKMKVELVVANDKHFNICNTFWRPYLSMNTHSHGDALIEFPSLWQKEMVLKTLLKDAMQNTILKAAITELAFLGVVAGPAYLLKCLIDLQLLRVDSLFEDGGSLLHYACIARRQDIVQYLLTEGVMLQIKDRQGFIPEQVTFCPKVKKLLIPPKSPLRQIPGRNPGNNQNNNQGIQLLIPSVQDKGVIFRLAEQYKSIYTLQRLLQSFEFNVNTECSNNGDFLIHIASQGGLCMLPQIHMLVNIQNADVELCNIRGMTPLMIAAAAGDTALCDILICVYGANPDKSNIKDGKTPLHYAVQFGHVDCVSCLIRRGANFDKEDHDFSRPDDISKRPEGNDCLNIIQSQRAQRIESLTQFTIQGKLRPDHLRRTDVNMTDQYGFTLLMLAALHNRVDSLKVLVDFYQEQDCKENINAQFVELGDSILIVKGLQTGMTSLSIAAFMGHTLCVSMLLQRGANPSIPDRKGYVPLHYAVEENHTETVFKMLEFFPETYIGIYKALQICRNTQIYSQLKEALQRRQDELVTGDLYHCSMTGDANRLYKILEEGDDINVMNGGDNWPLFIAAENGHLAVVKLLCERNAHVGKKHLPTNRTVLHISASLGHYQVLDYVLTFTGHSRSDHRSGLPNSSAILDINQLDSEGKTPLILAAEKGYMKIVKLLLSYGATTAILDKNGLLFSTPEYSGVLNEIESQRHHHTELVMKCVRDKSKTSVNRLRQVFLPKFDHNLRDKNYDTPLMVACYHGNRAVVKELLQSAVYSEIEEDDECDSDADSGMLEQTIYSGSSVADNDDLKRVSTYNIKDREELPADAISIKPKHPITLENLLNDVDRPKGLSIYHDGLVSHICAVNIFDMATPLHRALEGGDNEQIVEMLVKKDHSCVNAQNSHGLSPLHLACKLGRRKSLQQLLKIECLDLNLLTLDGQLPDDMCSSKNIKKILEKARSSISLRPVSETVFSGPSSLADAGHLHNNLHPKSSMAATSIDLDKVHEQFERMKLAQEKKQNAQTLLTTI